MYLSSYLSCVSLIRQHRQVFAEGDPAIVLFPRCSNGKMLKDASGWRLMQAAIDRRHTYVMKAIFQALGSGAADRCFILLHFTYPPHSRIPLGFFSPHLIEEKRNTFWMTFLHYYPAFCRYVLFEKACSEDGAGGSDEIQSDIISEKKRLNSRFLFHIVPHRRALLKPTDIFRPFLPLSALLYLIIFFSFFLMYFMLGSSISPHIVFARSDRKVICCNAQTGQIALHVAAVELLQKCLSAPRTFACFHTRMSNCYFWLLSTKDAQWGLFPYVFHQMIVFHQQAWICPLS